MWCLQVSTFVDHPVYDMNDGNQATNGTEETRLQHTQYIKVTVSDM